MFRLPGGALLAGRDQAHVYGISTTVTPIRRLFLDATFQYQPTSTTTADNGTKYIQNYQGDIYSLIASASYVLTTNTDFFSSYSYSKANYSQPFNGFAVPLGIDYDQHAVRAGLNHRFNATISGKLQYAFYHAQRTKFSSAQTTTPRSPSSQR